MPGVITEVRLGLRLEGASSLALQGTVDDGRFVLFEGDEGTEPVLSGPVSAAPLEFARLAGLGPRPEAGDDIPTLLAPGLASYDRAGLLDAWSEASREGTALASEDVAVWSAWSSWSRSRRRGVLRITMVADAGAAGLALIDVSEEGVIVQPATATDVWRSLLTLLPR
ncbi:MAG: hypothetical protein Q7T55_05135 [Solirubrobacteraceae bacterium]|nr:hypothetical protein [Solirubrobacteraceae bacterium]